MKSQEEMNLVQTTHCIFNKDADAIMLSAYKIATES